MIYFRDSKRELSMEFILVLLILLLQVSFGGIKGYEILFIPDGDGFLLRNKMTGQEQMYRLSGIDCPEYGQPLMDVAKKCLEILLSKAEWELIPHRRDPYGRIVASLVYNDSVLAAELVRVGFCFAYFPYIHKSPEWEQKIILDAQRQASREKNGLLSHPLYQRHITDCFARPFIWDRYPRRNKLQEPTLVPILPWDWRHWIQQETGLSFVEAINFLKNNPHYLNKFIYWEW